MIIIFQSTHHAIKAERVLLENKIKLKIIPVPRNISSDCGMAIKVYKGHEKTAIGFLEQNKILFNSYKDM